MIGCCKCFSLIFRKRNKKVTRVEPSKGRYSLERIYGADNDQSTDVRLKYSKYKYKYLEGVFILKSDNEDSDNICTVSPSYLKIDKTRRELMGLAAANIVK
jgi:hypothetical protein